MSLYVFRLCSGARKNDSYDSKDADRFFLFYAYNNVIETRVDIRVQWFTFSDTGE